MTSRSALINKTLKQVVSLHIGSMEFTNSLTEKSNYTEMKSGGDTTEVDNESVESFDSNEETKEQLDYLPNALNFSQDFISDKATSCLNDGSLKNQQKMRDLLTACVVCHKAT